MFLIDALGGMRKVIVTKNLGNVQARIHRARDEKYYHPPPG